MDDMIARDFFVPPFLSAWRWSDEGDAIVWANEDGGTIVLRVEVDQLLTRLAPYGLPPLTLIVLCIAAARGDWRLHQAEISAMVDRACPNEPLVKAALARGLENLRLFPASIRSDPDRLATALEQLVANMRSTATPQTSQRIARGLQYLGAYLLPDLNEQLSVALINSEILAPALRELSQRLAELDPESIERRHRSGLNLPLEPAPLPKRIADWLSAHDGQDVTLGAVARFARRIAATAQLPKPRTLPQDEQQGGLDGLANRGPLHRLLLSELAHEDLMLAARVANNEALYWRQDSPPQHSPRPRTIVLDGGLRLWGERRVLSAAVALAFAMRADPEQELKLANVLGSRLQERAMLRSTELLDFIAQLDTTAHPAAVLPTLSQLEGQPETLLVMAREAWDDADFQQALRKESWQNLFIATVSGDAYFELWQCNQRGRRRLRRVQIEEPRALQDIGRDVDAETPRDFPAFLRRRRVPIRIPDTSPRAELSRSLDSARGREFYSYDRHGSLLYWDERRFAPRVITDRLPPGEVLAFELTQNRRAIFVIRDSDAALKVVNVNVDSGDLACIDLAASPQNRAPHVAHNGALFFVEPQRIRTLNLSTGGFVEDFAFTMPPGARRMGRFIHFWDPSFVVLAMSFDGQSTVLEYVPHVTPNMILFDRTRVDGPWALDAFRLRLARTTDGRDYPIRANMQTPVTVRGISADGERLLLREFSSKVDPFSNDVLVDVSLLEGAEVPYGSRMPTPMAAWRSECLRKKIQGVGRSPDGALLIQTWRGQRFCLELSRKNQLQLAPWTGLAEIRPFTADAHFTKARAYSLLRHRSLSGHEFILDGRGLLHLSQGEIEMTLVLSEPELGLWLPDGRWYGPERFFASETGQLSQKISAEVARLTIARFLEGWVL